MHHSAWIKPIIKAEFVCLSWKKTRMNKDEHYQELKSMTSHLFHGSGWSIEPWLHSFEHQGRGTRYISPPFSLHLWHTWARPSGSSILSSTYRGGWDHLCQGTSRLPFISLLILGNIWKEKGSGIKKKKKVKQSTEERLRFKCNRGNSVRRKDMCGICERRLSFVSRLAGAGWFSHGGVGARLESVWASWQEPPPPPLPPSHTYRLPLFINNPCTLVGKKLRRRTSWWAIVPLIIGTSSLNLSTVGYFFLFCFFKQAGVHDPLEAFHSGLSITQLDELLRLITAKDHSS